MSFWGENGAAQLPLLGKEHTLRAAWMDTGTLLVSKYQGREFK